MNTGDPGGTIPPKYRNPVIHDRSACSYVGSYQVTDQALKNYDVARDRFGTTEVINPDGSSFIVKDYQYVLQGGSVGMEFLPVNDFGAVENAKGDTVFGSVLIDEFLRKRMKLKPTDAIYAPIYYIHPEENKGTLLQLANPVTSNKVELGITHWGAYLGNGRTSNSPALYHNRSWSVGWQPDTKYGYPANVMIMSLDGVDQAMLNKNMLLADNFINYGVRFPQDYKNSKFRMANLNTALMFYKDWILEKNYLKTDSSWFTFCAAHKTLVATIGMNLPHNPAAFKEVYGEVEGQKFYAAFCKNHFTLRGEEFSEEMQTDFEPLWKKHGLTPAQIRPFTLDEYYAYDAARREGTLKIYKGFVPLAPGEGMPWGPQMTSDIIYDFVQFYGDFVDAGAIVMCVTIFMFAAPAAQRSGISQLEYLLGALPIVQHGMEGHARMYAAQGPGKSYKDSAYYKATFAALYTALGGTDKNIDATANPDFETLITDYLGAAQTLQENWKPELLAWFSMMRVRQNWDSIMAGGAVPIATAYVDFMNEVQGELEKARNLVVSRPGRIQYNTPPALAHLVGTKMFASSQFVSLETVVTVMDHNELERVGGHE